MWNMVSLHCQDFKLVGPELHLGFKSDQIVLEMDGRRFYLRTKEPATFVFKTHKNIFGNLEEYYLFAADDGTEMHLQSYFMFASINRFQQMFRDAVKRVLPLFEESLKLQAIEDQVQLLAQTDDFDFLVVDSEEVDEVVNELDQQQIRIAMDRALAEKDYETAQKLYPLWNYYEELRKQSAFVQH